MNHSGITKYTDYIGKYLDENYELPDRRDDPAYEKYNEGIKWLETRIAESRSEAEGLLDDVDVGDDMQ